MAFADDFPRLDEKDFPNLVADGYILTSPETENYNCIAWAADDKEHWWWPDPFGDYYWPIPRRENNIDAFVEAYETCGYEVCVDGGVERGYEKIAIFANSKGPQHASKQRRDGKWTSKLGDDKDIEHPLDAVNGPLYGTVVQFMRRKVKKSVKKKRAKKKRKKKVAAA